MSTTTEFLNLIKPELTDTADITAMNGNWDAIDKRFKSVHNTMTSMATNIYGLKNPSYVPYTLLASGWTGDVAPYTYTIGGYDGKTVEVVESISMTTDQLEVIENAKIKSDPSSNDNILYAFGDKPTVDVPVMLIVR